MPKLETPIARHLPAQYISWSPAQHSRRLRFACSAVSVGPSDSGRLGSAQAAARQWILFCTSSRAGDGAARTVDEDEVEVVHLQRLEAALQLRLDPSLRVGLVYEHVPLAVWDPSPSGRHAAGAGPWVGGLGRDEDVLAAQRARGEVAAQHLPKRLLRPVPLGCVEQAVALHQRGLHDLGGDVVLGAVLARDVGAAEADGGHDDGVRHDVAPEV